MDLLVLLALRISIRILELDCVPSLVWLDAKFAKVLLLVRFVKSDN